MKEKFKNIGVIGTGHMGQAIIKGLKAARLKEGILIFDKNRKKSRKISKDLRVKEAKNLKDLVKTSKAIIICVRPQDIDNLLSNISGFELQNKLIISIVAGVTTSYILKKLETKVAVVRIMPNINAVVQESVNAICGGKYAKKKDLIYTQRVFGTLGENFVVSEKKMDAITAISGSGPAYTALFIKALLAAAKKNGLTGGEAEKIINQTLRGTLKMLETQKVKPEDFIKRVKSKGGTTEAAFKVFKREGFESIILKAVCAAKKRSQALGKK